MKRVASFTTMSGKKFTYDEEWGLFISEDGICVERMPSNVCCYDEEEGVLHRFNDRLQIVLGNNTL